MNPQTRKIDQPSTVHRMLPILTGFPNMNEPGCAAI